MKPSRWMDVNTDTEAAAHQADVLRNVFSYKFRNIQMKIPVLEPVFNKVAGLHLSVNIAKILITAGGCF